MLCDSTRSLLQAILESLKGADQAGWDDQIECGNQCLYEMHQMTRPSYQAHKSGGTDKWPSHIPDTAGLTRAMPHVKAMMRAIRSKDRTAALVSGNAALIEMNRPVVSKAADVCEVKEIRVKLAPPAIQKQRIAVRTHHPKAEKRTSVRVVRAAGSN